MKTIEQLRQQAVAALWPASVAQTGLTYAALGNEDDKQRVDRVALALREAHVEGEIAAQARQPEQDDSFSVEVGGQRFTAEQWAAVLTYSRAMQAQR